MLQKYSPEQAPQDQSGQSLTPAAILDILKRRFLYFFVPFAILLAIGATVVMLLPPVYLAEGKILV